MLGPRCKERQREREDGTKELEAGRGKATNGEVAARPQSLQTGVLESQVFEQARHIQCEAAARNGAMAARSERIVLQEVACRWETTR
jgi:hypothetical protein